MRPWREIVHFSCSCCSTLCSFLHQCIYLIWWSNSPFT